MTSAATSKSNFPIICKILIDNEEYDKLKRIENRQNLAYSHQKSALEESLPQVGAGLKVDSVESVTSQKGSGWNLGFSGAKDFLASLFEDFQNKLITLITKLLEDKLNEHLKQYGKKITSTKKTEPQTGSGSDLVSIPAGTLPRETGGHMPLGTSEFVKSTSQQQDNSDLNKLLLKVPKKFKKKAHILLKFFYENPMDVTWDSKGVVTVNDVIIPNSNIFTLFPALYKNKFDISEPGLHSLTTYLSSSGLGNLFKNGKTVGLTRKKSYRVLRKLTKQQLKKLHRDSSWYKMDLN